VTVGGPFPSLEALLRTQGLRRYLELDGTPGSDALFEIFEWRGFHFTIEPEGPNEPQQYTHLKAALLGEGPVRVLHPGAEAIWAATFAPEEALELLRRSPGSGSGDITLNGEPLELRGL
jgi:hypothetical protein